MEKEPDENTTEIREALPTYTTNWGREISPVEIMDMEPSVDWKTAVFIVGVVLLVEAFTLGLILITWWVIK